MASITKFTPDAILRAANELKSLGIKVTQKSVREKLGGGSFTTINKALVDWGEADQDPVANWLRTPWAITKLLRGESLPIPINKLHLEYLGYVIHDAYKLSDGLVQAKYYRSILQAFAACYVLQNNRPGNTTDYFLSNLGRGDCQTVQELVDELSHNMPDLISQGTAEFGARNLEVFLRDEIKDIPLEAVLHALEPFMPDLLAIATRHAYLRTGKPLDVAGIVYSPSEKLSTEHYWLQIHEEGVNFSAAIGLSTHQSIHVCNNFIQFQRFYRLLNGASFSIEPSKNSEYQIISTGPDMPIYIRYHQHQLEFSQNHLLELRELFDKAISRAENQSIFARMIAIYGDI